MSRNADGLGDALQRIGAMRTECAALGAGAGARDYNFGLVQHLELGWLLDVSETIVASAIERTESRGAHVRTDYPAQDDAQAARVSVVRADSGRRWAGSPSRPPSVAAPSQDLGSTDSGGVK